MTAGPDFLKLIKLNPDLRISRNGSCSILEPTPKSQFSLRSL